MSDPYKYMTPDALITPVTSCIAITASATEFTATRGIRCNADGNFTVLFADDQAAVTLALLAGQDYPYRIIKCTAGTGLFALR